MNQPMSVLTSVRSVEWFTPPEIVQTVRATFSTGEIALDPASCDGAQAIVCAGLAYGPGLEVADGLRSDLKWIAPTLFLNPPFDSCPRWAVRWLTESNLGHFREGILLVNASLGYRWFEGLWRKFPCVFLRERVAFVNGATGKAGGFPPAKT